MICSLHSCRISGILAAILNTLVYVALLGALTVSFATIIGDLLTLARRYWRLLISLLFIENVRDIRQTNTCVRDSRVSHGWKYRDVHRESPS